MERSENPHLGGRRIKLERSEVVVSSTTWSKSSREKWEWPIHQRRGGRAKGAGLPQAKVSIRSKKIQRKSTAQRNHSTAGNALTGSQAGQRRRRTSRLRNGVPGETRFRSSNIFLCTGIDRFERRGQA